MLSFSSHFQIHSDLDDDKGNLRYFLKGRGANQDPFHVFVVHERTGFIRVTQLLDRELISMYNVSETKRLFSIMTSVHSVSTVYINICNVLIKPNEVSNFSFLVLLGTMMALWQRKTSTYDSRLLIRMTMHQCLKTSILGVWMSLHREVSASFLWKFLTNHYPACDDSIFPYD